MGRKENDFEMAVRKMKAKAVRVVCNNCFQQTIGIRDETGVVKYRCSRCGALTVSKVMGRRHVQLFSVIELEFAQLILFLHGLYLLCYFASLNQI